VLPPGSFAQFADKLTGLEQLWREVLHMVVKSDAFAALLSTTLQRGALDALFRMRHDTDHRTFIETLLAR